MREKINMRCSVCEARNYQTTKDKKRQKEKIELNKFCPKCRKHTLHKEGKISG